MLSIDREAQRERKRLAFIQTLLLWIIALGWLSVILALILALMTHAAANAVCLSKKEARTLWPKQHLYWYGPNHCWSNRRGPPRNLKFDPVFSKAAYAKEMQSLPAPVVQDPTKTAGGDRAEPPRSTVPLQIAAADEPWPVAVKPIRVIEIIRPSIPIPVTPVEAAELPSLPKPEPINLIPLMSGALAAIFVTLLIAFNRRIVSYVKHGAIWIHRRIGQARAKISSLGFRPRNKQSSLPPLNIGYFLRRVDRAGRYDHLAKVLARVEDTGDPVDEWRPPDDSALACWARSIRAKEGA